MPDSTNSNPSRWGLIRAIPFIGVIGIVLTFFALVPETKRCEASKALGTDILCPYPTNTPVSSLNPEHQNTLSSPEVFEDFEDTLMPSDWTRSGDWRFVKTDGNFALNLNSGTGEITFGSDKWVDYELTFKVQTRDLSKAKALYVYVRDTGTNKIALAIDFMKKSISLVAIAPNVGQGILYTLDFPFKNNWPLEFSLFVTKNWVTLYINKLYFTYQKFDVALDSGLIKFRTADTTLLLDDFQVDLLSIKP